MKLATFTTPDNPGKRLGVSCGDKILDLHYASAGQLPLDMISFLDMGAQALETTRRLLKSLSKAALIPLSKIGFKAALPNPASLKDFFAFEAHAKAGAARRGETLPEAWYEIPAYYKGNHREIYGPGDEIPWPAYTRKLDFECEIACVIGKKGRDLTPQEAAKHIFGYMIFNDFSARDIQKREMALRMGPTKGKDFANAFGPWLVTADEVDPREDFSMTVKVNGKTWSKSHFKDQYWGFPLMISHVSQCETVYPGDVFGSGTFYRGCGLDLDRWIKPGDKISLTVPALGTLTNRIGTPKAQKELNYKNYGRHSKAG